MQILIDADGCPVVDVTVKLATENRISCIILCDASHIFYRDGARTITVSKGADSVDFVLINMVQSGDIVVTQDYGLAAMCLARRAIPISQNGMIYNDDNIDMLLLKRYTAKKIRMQGGKLRAIPKRTKEQDKKFEHTLKMIIKRRMKMNYTFAHNNFNVLDLEKSLKFYRDALGLTETRRIDAKDGSFIIVYLGDGKSEYLLELTWLRNRKEPYNLGDNEFHLAFRVDDFEGALKKHQEMGCVCFENKKMGIYFISDPDGYWLEIIPSRM